jgi:CDP-diacylglycerol--glycerol-3-phosphate 3-phosphatidyltransferase/cardiolipin synthase
MAFTSSGVREDFDMAQKFVGRPWRTTSHLQAARCSLFNRFSFLDSPLALPSFPPDSPSMTLATKITLVRLALIPLYAWLASRYGTSVSTGQPDEPFRLAAMAVFLTAGLSDALDGWIARRFNQHSSLGRVLDPLADKFLMLTALIVLCASPWSAQHKVPFWFAGLVVLRDVLSSLAAWAIWHRHGRVRISPHWTGKVATVLQLLALGWVMLQLHFPPSWIVMPAAGLFTFASGMCYIAEGWRQYRLGPPP